ncbi:MAG: hypothetical protein RSC43_07175 [Clostridia bacterium]
MFGGLFDNLCDLGGDSSLSEDIIKTGLILDILDDDEDDENENEEEDE